MYMERNYEFTIGQRVWMNDPDDGSKVYGVVTDKSTDKVFIQWDDLSSPTDHPRSEFADIRLSR